MRFLLYLYFIVLLPAFCYADAGFNIGRPKAPCYAVFKGIDKLNDFEFFKIPYGGDNLYFADSSHKLNNNDTLQLDYSGYSKSKRGELGSVKILIRNKITQQFVDSFTLTAEGYNLNINFTEAENNKAKYTIDKSKAEYPYILFQGDRDNARDGSVTARNKYILISLSALGFFILVFMFTKHRGNNSQQTVR